MNPQRANGRRRVALVSSAAGAALLVLAFGPGAWLYGLDGEAARWFGAFVGWQAVARPSPLRELEGREGVLKVFTGSDIEEDELEDALESASREEPVVVLIDDGELLEDCDAEDEFKRLVQRGSDRGIGLVIAGDEDDVCSGFSGWQVDMKKGTRGILLSPQDSSSGELIGIRVTRSHVGGQIAPGRGLLHLGDGELVTVTVPG